MNTRKKLMASLSIAVVLTACGQGEASTTTDAPTTTAPATTVTNTTLATADPVDGDSAAGNGDAVPWSMGSTGPGTFASTSFVAPFTFVLGEGWLPIFPEGREILNMRLPERAVLFILETEAESVESFLTDIAEQADVELENVRDVEVGGLSAVRFEAVGTGSVRVRQATGAFESGLQDEAVRVTVVAVADTVVAMLEVTPIDDPEGARPETLAVIDSIMWVAP